MDARRIKHPPKDDTCEPPPSSECGGPPPDTRDAARTRTEESLRTALRQQTAIFEASLVGIMVLENRIITSVNRRLTEMLGYAPEELIGKGPQQVHLSMENFHEFGQRYYWRLAEREIVNIEYPLRHKDGRTVWCLFNGRAVAPPDLSKGAVWVIDDITQRKMDEERREAEVRRIESLLALGQMRDKPVRELAAFAVEEAIGLTKSRIGYLAALNEDETVLTMLYWSRSAYRACQIGEKPILYELVKTGLWGEAVRQRRPIITNDYAAANPWKKGLPEGHVPISRHMNLPIFEKDRIVAVAGVGNKETDYNEHDVRQLHILMDGWWQVAERKRAEAELWKALERTKQKEIELRGLLDASGAVLECHTFEESARRIFDACREATGATAGYVALLSYDGMENEVLFLESGGMPCNVDTSLPMPIRGLRGIAYAENKVVWENDFAHSEWVRFMPPGHAELQNVMFAPLAIEGKVAGIMGLANKNSDFTRDDARIAAAFGDMLAIGLRRARGEETLLASEHRFRSFVENAHDIVYSLTPDGRFTYVSPNWREFFGEPPDIPVGRSFEAYVLPEDIPVCHGFLQTVLESGEKHSGVEYRVRRADGSVRWHTSTGSPLRDESGKIAGYVGISRDVTERKEYELKLARSKEDLEHINAELEKAILRANEMAVAAEAGSIAKSRFLANMSHEIRTPMNGVLGMAGLLLDTELTPEQRDYAERIAGSGEALLSIINDILDYSKIEAGRLDMEVIDFDLRTTIEEMNDLLAIRAQGRGLEYVCCLDPSVPSQLRGDPGRLRQVLINLVGNAIKFTAEGEVRLNIAIEREEGNLVLLRFEVADTGIGIPAGRLELLFDPFTQADASTSRRFGGTGLGLTISKQLIELMGGEIGAESEEGKGSTFWCTVQFEKQPAAAAREPAVPRSLREKRVLIVDDNESNRIVVHKQLDSWQIPHEEAVDGITALAALRDAVRDGKPFDIALLDHHMPGMSGEELASQIKGDAELRDTALVLMTSMGHRKDARKAGSIGFAAYLLKPVRQSQFFNCLASLTSVEAQARACGKGYTQSEADSSENDLARARILLAEDNATNQLVVTAMLKKRGIQVDAVANGLEAVRALQERPYDLVLMDVQMPELDGLDATRRIRAAGSKVIDPKIPVIAMTAHAMKGDREICINAGMDDYLTKPVQPDKLFEAIRRWACRKDAGENLPEDPVREAPPGGETADLGELESPLDTCGAESGN